MDDVSTAVDYVSYLESLVSLSQSIAVASYITIGLLIGALTFYMIKR